MIGKLPYLLAAFVVGLVIAAQPAWNAEVARHAGHPLSAASLSLVTSMVLVVPVALVLAPRSPAFLAELPWWAFLGGVAGALFVLGGLMVAPAVGVVAYVGCLLLGQIVGAALIDQFGAFNVAVRPISTERALAILLLIGGVILYLRSTTP